MRTMLFICLLFVVASSSAQYAGNGLRMPCDTEEMIIIDTDKDYLDLRREYKEYCDHEVMDTIKEYGYTFSRYKLSSDTIPILEVDTIWIEWLKNKLYIPKYDIERTIFRTSKREIESPEGFWDWVDKNYLK